MMESLPLASASGIAAGNGVAVGEGAAGWAEDWPEDWEVCAAGAWVGAIPRASAATVGCGWASSCGTATGAGGSVGLAGNPQATTTTRATTIMTTQNARLIFTVSGIWLYLSLAEIAIKKAIFQKFCQITIVSFQIWVSL